MTRWIAALLLFACPLAAAAQPAPISRRDGLLFLWQSIHRPATDVRETPYTDVKRGDTGFTEITYAKSRNILPDDEDAFHPDASLQLGDALVWLLRTRNVDDPKNITPATLSGFLLKYPIALVKSPKDLAQTLTEDQLVSLTRSLDEDLGQEVHEVSLYGEKWQGQGTAFGETFDMNAITAAHRTLPYNTLVKVTNVDNGKSVVVRINDRGPYVAGRDMDMSLAAFIAIAPRSQGVLHATFQRLGDATLVGQCADQPRYQTRLGRHDRLLPGIPWFLKLGTTLTVSASKGFVVRSVTYPDGTLSELQDWIVPSIGQTFSLKPSVAGDYAFVLGSLDGHRRVMTMHVVTCDQ